jgi:hypothetical protein
MADIIIVDFFNRKTVKKMKPDAPGRSYLKRWTAFVRRVGIRNIDPIEYPPDVRRVKIPYCGMLDRCF